MHAYPQQHGGIVGSLSNKLRHHADGEEVGWRQCVEDKYQEYLAGDLQISNLTQSEIIFMRIMQLIKIFVQIS